MVKNPSANAEDKGLIPDPRRAHTHGATGVHHNSQESTTTPGPGL